MGFDAFLQYTFTTAGTYYIGVSNSTNITYDPVSGNLDTSGGFNSIGDYQLIVQTPASTPIDNDDSIPEATTLGAVGTTPITTAARIDPDYDVDMYKFTVTNGQIVEFDIDTATNGPGGLGSYLRLFSSSGQVLASNDNAAAPGEASVGFDAFLRYTFTGAGTFYIAVSNSNNIAYDPLTGDGDTPGGSNAIGDYQLIVTGLPADPDDTLTESPSIGQVTAAPNTTNGSISPDIDVDIIRFIVTDGQTVDFDIDTPTNGGSGLGSYLRIFNGSGQPIASNDNAAAPGETTIGLDAYLRYTFATGGTYYVGVSNSTNINYDPLTGAGDTAGGSNSTGDYQLIIQTAPSVATDSDDSIIEAPNVGAVSTTPITVSGGISPDTDVDMVRFTVTAGQVVDFDIDTTLNGSTGLNSYLRVFNASGQQLAANDNAAAPSEGTVGFDAYVRFTFATAGTYFVAVSNSLNTAYNAGTGDGDTGGGSIGEYVLSISSPTTAVDDADDATPEAIQLGAVLTTPTTVSGQISPDTDVDMYSFTVTAGQVVDFDIDTTLNGNGGLQSYLRVFNGQGQQLAANDNAAAPGEASVGFDAYVRFTFATAGTFYVAVSNSGNITYDPSTGNGDTGGGSNGTGSYQLILSTPTTEVGDPDDSIAEATALGQVSTTAATANGQISPDIDVDMTSFVVTAGQTVDFDLDTTLNGTTGLNSYLRLFNSQGQELASNNNGMAPGEDTIGFDAYLRFTFATGGTYFIGVSNATNITYNALTGDGDTAGGSNAIGTYQLTIQALPVDLDDAINEAIAIDGLSTTPQTISDTISPDIDVDMFRVTVTAGQIVDFDIDTTTNGPGGLNSYLRLFDSTGTMVGSNNSGAAPGEIKFDYDAYLRFNVATSGTYYLAVSNANNIVFDPLTGNGDTAGGIASVGNYQLTVQLITPIVDDTDDTISEAVSLGAISTTPKVVNSSITSSNDVNMVSFTVIAGQVVSFNIDTPTNGGSGLQSYLRLFNSAGQQLAFNDNAAAPGEGTVGFDAYLQYTFATAGTYYLAVSNAANIVYDPVTGVGDTTSTTNAVGPYTLTIRAEVPAASPTLSLSLSLTSIPEIGGTSTATISRIDSDNTLPLTINLVSSNTSTVSVPSSVTIPAGLSSTTFTVTAIHSTNLGTRSATITASSSGFPSVFRSIQVIDSDNPAHNNAKPADVNGDGNVTPIDILLIIRYINRFGSGAIAPSTAPPFVDVNADGIVTALDALLVISKINSGSGEGESNSAALPSTTSAAASTAPVATQETFTSVSSNVKSRRWSDSVDGFFGQY